MDECKKASGHTYFDYNEHDNEQCFRRYSFSKYENN